MGGDGQHWACAECARKCSKAHGRRSPPSHLSFFKIMLGQFKKSLIVPPKFAHLLGNLVGQKISLENLDGHRWEVKLLKVDNFLTFQQGWNEFVLYHSIQVGEMVVFKFTSPASFVVQIFGRSACERSHFCEIIGSDMHKICPTECLCFRKDGRKDATCRVGSCIQDKVSSQKLKSIRTTASESFSSPHSSCKTDGDFHKRKRSATDCLGPHKDGRTHDKYAPCCHPTDKDSPRKRKATRTAPHETLSTPKNAAKDAWGDSNMQSSSHDVTNTTIVDYSEVPCTVVSEDAHKGQEESQIALSDVCANVNMNPVNDDTEKVEKGSERALIDMCTNVNMSEMDHPELPCKLSKTESPKEKEMIATLSSEFISSRVGKENADKSLIIEEKSFYSTNSKLSQISCGKKLKGNKNDLPTTENEANIAHSLSEMGISPTSYSAVAPISCEMSSSREFSCKNLVIELPISGSSNKEVVFEEEKSAAVKESILEKVSTINNFISAYDMATYRFLVDPEGTCYIVQNSIGNPVSNNASANLSHNDMEDAKCNDTLAPMGNEISFHSDVVFKDLCSAPIVGSRDEESAKKTVLTCTTDNVCDAQNCLLDTLGSNAATIPKENDALSIGDASQQMSRIPKSQEGSHTMDASREHVGVKQDAVSQKNEMFKPCLKEPVLKAVKTEIMDPDDLSSPYFSFSLVVNTLSWHELSEPLPSNCGRWRLERKVVLLRDPAMRVWPVLYHESFRFTGFLGGWEAFVTANNVRMGDICYFEQASLTEAMLRVQISRASSV